MWNTILDILKEKAAQGVDIRVIYDDMGCIMTLPNGYNKNWKATESNAVSLIRLYRFCPANSIPVITERSA